MRSNAPSTVCHPKSVWAIAALCVFATWFAADNATAAYTVSRGRQVLLNRGLQVQAVTYPFQSPIYPYPDFDLNLWNTANFNTINLYDWPNPDLLSQLQPKTQFARCYAIFEHKDGSGEIVSDPETKYLSMDELSHVGKLVGYQYGDELNARILEMLPDVRDTYSTWRTYGDVLAYTDFSSGIDSSQIVTYMNETRPDMLMFNCYPAYSGSEMWSSRTNWYSTMQQYRNLAKAGYTIDGVNSGPIPYAQHLKLHRNTNDGDAPLPDESFIRLNQNASWAFGFTYAAGWTYKDGDNSVPPIMLSADGTPTVAFDYVAETNRQSLNLGPALVRLVSTDIRMIGGTEHDSRPSNIQPWQAGAGGDPYMWAITPWSTEYNQPDLNYSDVLIGYFAPLLTENPGCTFVDGLPFMIVNGATGGTPAALAQKYRIRFSNFGDSGYDSLVRLDRETGLVVPVALTYDGGSQYHLDLTLEGGTGELFAYWNSSMPLPTIPEPGAIALMVTGLLGLVYYAWRKQSSP